MTEKEARKWLADTLDEWSYYGDENYINSFVRLGKERGYIKRYVLERAREATKIIKKNLNSLHPDYPHQIDNIINLYEQAVKEAKGDA